MPRRYRASIRGASRTPIASSAALACRSSATSYYITPHFRPAGRATRRRAATDCSTAARAVGPARRRKRWAVGGRGAIHAGALLRRRTATLRHRRIDRRQTIVRLDELPREDRWARWAAAPGVARCHTVEIS